MSAREIKATDYAIGPVDVIQVIRIQYCHGAGVASDCCRTVVEYRDMEGKFLARSDPCAKAVYKGSE